MTGPLETVRYTYRLRPGAHATAALMDEWHRCRWLWNEAVHQQRIGNKPTVSKLGKMLTEARGRTSWLRAGSYCAQKCTLRTYAQALQRSYTVKGQGRPKVKRRKVALPTLEYTRGKFRLRDNRLVFHGGTTIPVVWSRELPSEPSSVRVYRDSLGDWYASFVVRRPLEPVPEAEADGAIGIDWGVTTTATTTDPAYDLPYGAHRKRSAAELAKVQRRMTRRRRARGVPASKGYQSARKHAARVHKKAARQNVHAAQQWARRLVADHQTIAVEDFKPKFLTRSTMARKAADAAIGAAKRELIYRGSRAGRTVILVPPAYTTMTCSRCGERQARLELAERTFRCSDCGHIVDRDRNAAGTILATAERIRAGADDVRRAASSSRGGGSVRSEPGIPSGSR